MGTTYSHYSFVLNSINILLKASFVLKWPESRLASAMWVEKSGHATVVFGRNCCCCRRHLRVEMLVPAQGWNWSLYLGQGHEVAKKEALQIFFLRLLNQALLCGDLLLMISIITSCNHFSFAFEDFLKKIRPRLPKLFFFTKYHESIKRSHRSNGNTTAMMAQNRNSITWFVRVNRKDQLIFYNRGLDCSISRERKPPGFKRHKKGN